nr:MAG TPA: hypothetical protein [Caudoviricetes sp.]
MRVRYRLQNSHKTTKVYTYCPLFAPFFIKKTWQHRLPSDNRKKQKHSARNRLKVHL